MVFENDFLRLVNSHKLLKVQNIYFLIKRDFLFFDIHSILGNVLFLGFFYIYNTWDYFHRK